MKLLLLTLYFPPEIGAPQTRLRAMTSELKRLGHEVEVVTAMPNYPRGAIYPGYRGLFYRKEVRDGVVIRRLWAYAALGGGLRRALNYLSFTFLCILGLLRAGKPDYVFVESPPLILSLPGYLFSRLWRARLILNVADLSPKTEAAMGLLKSRLLLWLMSAYEAWIYRKADWINAITPGIQEYLLQEKKVPARKVLFLPNGVDTTLFQPRPADLALKQALGLDGKNIILYPGTHGHAHALDVVLQSAKLLENRPDIHFLFVGDGSDKARLQGIRNRLGLWNVTFHHPVSVEQLVRYFSIAECGLASLRAIPIYEAARPAKIFPIWASGKPLLLVGHGESAQLVERANAGIVVPPEKPEALADAVLRLMDNPDLRRTLGANGRTFVDQNLRWSQLIGDWLARLTPPNSANGSHGSVGENSDSVPRQSAGELSCP